MGSISILKSIISTFIGEHREIGHEDDWVNHCAFPVKDNCVNH